MGRGLVMPLPLGALFSVVGFAAQAQRGENSFGLRSGTVKGIGTGCRVLLMEACWRKKEEEQFNKVPAAIIALKNNSPGFG